MMWRFMSAFLAIAFQVSVAIAEPAAIAVDANADWTHQKSGVVLQHQILDMQRTAVKDYGTNQLDIFATYPIKGEIGEATVYVFRAGLPNASVWHDRILAVIGSGRLGTADFASAVRTPFAGPGGSGGGLRSVVPMTGGSVSASGISIFAKDDWLIAIRMSTTKLSRDQLDAKLAEFTAALRMPAIRNPAPDAYLIENCTDALPTKNAKRAPADMGTSLMAALLGGIAEDKASKDDKADEAKIEVDTRRFCRDAASTSGYGVYRLGPAAEGFVVAFGDAGAAAWVGRDPAAQLLGRGTKQYALTLTTVDSRMNYAAFKSLPSVSQVVEAISRERPISSSNRSIDGKAGNTINIQAQ